MLGFSFVELLVSAAIIGLLASIAVPVIQTSVKRQKERDLRIALRDIRQGIDAYKQAGAAGRLEVKQDQSGYPPTLNALVQGVEDISRPEHPKLYFLRRIPRNPFFPDLNAKAIDTWGKRSFASPPEKPEEGEDVFDVYTNSNAMGLNGVPYKEW
jgi:general secretion pathway protein G